MGLKPSLDDPIIRNFNHYVLGFLNHNKLYALYAYVIGIHLENQKGGKKEKEPVIQLPGWFL